MLFHPRNSTTSLLPKKPTCGYQLNQKRKCIMYSSLDPQISGNIGKSEPSTTKWLERKPLQFHDYVNNCLPTMSWQAHCDTKMELLERLQRHLVCWNRWMWHRVARWWKYHQVHLQCHGCVAALFLPNQWKVSVQKKKGSARSNIGSVCLCPERIKTNCKNTKSAAYNDPFN